MPEPHMRSPLGRAVGLGSAKSGVGQWWLQRLTAVALVPLAVWFVVGVIAHLGADFAAFRRWIAEPGTAIAFILLLIAVFYHSALGFQVVIEDYVHSELPRLGLITAARLIFFGLAVAGVFAVLRMAFGGAP
ncbi:MAG TPA: succinate dehydrogenase, hydrophobic membrane anchor protein [Stellaceae bacterium]|jgi:succinate dehydrogenase / fumarate reductase membrane anchor subunit|nr:succinate dehydrogenase, hydrophobic membrane anchor protein [Stellaceae bacterium]